MTRWAFRTVIVAAIVATMGCSGGGGSDASDGAMPLDALHPDGMPSPDATDAAPPTDTIGDATADAGNTVTVTYVNDFISSSGDAPVPQPIATTPNGAYVLSGSAFEFFAATHVTTGGFTIPNVPPGEYYLQVGTDFIVTSARTVDIGNDVVSRATVATASSFSTSVSVSLTNVAPWQTSDDLELIAGDTGAWFFSPQLSSGTTLATGATSITGLAIDWDGEPLLSGASGDVLFVSQLAGNSATDGTVYQTLARSLQTSSAFMITDGVTTPLAGALSAPSTTGSIALDWHRSAFDSLASDVYPGAETLSLEGGVAVAAGGIAHGPLRPFAHVVSLPRTPATTDVNLGTVSYTNPYPAAWSLFGYAIETFALIYSLPGGSNTAQAATVVTYSDATSFGGAPIAPGIGTVGSITVNGMNAVTSTTLSAVGMSPTLAWTAPTMGTATRYVIGVYQIFVDTGETTVSNVGAIETTDTNLVIPPGLMESGNTYVFMVRAVALPNTDAQQHPFRDSFPHAEADAYTGIVAP